MTTIQIMKHNKELLDEYSEGSFDEKLKQLINDAGMSMPLLEAIESPTSTMRISKRNKELLDMMKITSSESYENVIVRLLIHAKTLNKSND